VQIVKAVMLMLGISRSRPVLLRLRRHLDQRGVACGGALRRAVRMDALIAAGAEKAAVHQKHLTSPGVKFLVTGRIAPP
jgi:hypothetical protein